MGSVYGTNAERERGQVVVILACDSIEEIVMACGSIENIVRAENLQISVTNAKFYSHGYMQLFIFSGLFSHLCLCIFMGLLN